MLLKKIVLSVISLIAQILFSLISLIPSAGFRLTCVKVLASLMRSLPLPKAIKGIFVERSKKLKATGLDFEFDSKVNGVRWVATGFPDILTRHLLFEGTYQSDVLLALDSFVKEGDIVYDIGGHHGLMALKSSLAVGDNGSVITFEPNPSVRPLLKENVALNGFSNIVVEELALSDRKGSIPFFAQEGDVTWNSTIIQGFVADNAKKIMVETMTLDEYVEEKKLVPNVIKIDTEGSELMILKGGMNTLKKYNPVLIMEFNASAAKAADTTIEKLVQSLKEESYELYYLEQDSNGYCNDVNKLTAYALDVPGNRNVICLPESRRPEAALAT